MSSLSFFFSCHADHLDLHVLTPSFPPRRSSDLPAPSPPTPRQTPRRTRTPPERSNLRPKPVVFDVKGAQVRGGGCCSLAPRPRAGRQSGVGRSEEHTSELQSLMRISYAVFCLKKTQTNSEMPQRESITHY